MKLIPAPKKYEEKSGAIITAFCAISAEKPEWQTNAEAFADIFERIHGVRAEYGKKGGIELCFDAALNENAYVIECDGALRIFASEKEGLLYGLATALQLCSVKDGMLCFPNVSIEDAPDKDYRAIMVDLGREWHPFDKLLKFTELCFFYKVRYLNLHFTDNKLYTLPSKAFPRLCIEGKYYTEEQIKTLRHYAERLGVILVPEFECPGHAPVLNTYYPEVFGDRGAGDGGKFYNESGQEISNKSLLCASRKSAVEGVKTLLNEISELFPDSPYIHIGGDEANISLWNQCEDCREYMKKNGIDGVYGLYSDYVARIAKHVISLGKTPIVWEGFPENGADKIPSETVVISWENHYQTTRQLLGEGFRIINSSWKPLYIVPGMIASEDPINWTAKNIFEWNVYNWQHWWPKSEATLNPITVEPTEQVLGAMLCAWEMTFDQEIGYVMGHLPAMSERVWTVRCTRTFSQFCEAFRHVQYLAARIIQDI